MKMYLVRRYVDNSKPGEYGVNDTYYAIGLFTDKAIANTVMQVENKRIPEDKKDAMEVDILVIETNKIYNNDEQIVLGGVWYDT